MDLRMLYLTRKVGESIIINENIELTIVEVRGKTTKLGITFPPEATVLRKELHDRIKQENLAAALGDDMFALRIEASTFRLKALESGGFKHGHFRARRPG